MNWIEVIAYAISGALGAALAYPILARNKELRAIYGAAALLAMYANHRCRYVGREVVCK